MDDAPDHLSPALLGDLRAGEPGALAACYDRFGARVYRLPQEPQGKFARAPVAPVAAPGACVNMHAKP